MANKLDLEVCRGSVFSESNSYSLKYNIKNNDSTSIPLSAVRVVSYAWLQDKNPELHFTSGVTSLGTIQQFATVVISDSPAQNGIVTLYPAQNSYTVYHDNIDSSLVAPQVSLIVPNGGSEMSPITITQRTNTSFTIVLNDGPATEGYSVSWMIPNSYVEYSGSDVLTGTVSVSLEKLDTPYIRDLSNITNTKIIYTLNTSASINPGYALVGADVFLQHDKIFLDGGNTSDWYSDPQGTTPSNTSDIVLQQFNGSVWSDVVEYTENGYDTNTGTSPVSKNTILISLSATDANNQCVYISNDDINPIAVNRADKNELFLHSNGAGSSIRRSLIKYDLSAFLPSSATSIINSILRLNVNSITSAWDYTDLDGSVSIHRVSASWDESEVTWSDRFTGIQWNTIGGDIAPALDTWRANSSMSNFVSGSNNDFYIDLNVTEAVEYWKNNPSENFGLLIKLTPSTQESSSSNIEYRINSMRNGDVLTRPTLIVAYDDISSTIIPTGEIIYPIDEDMVVGTTFNVSAVANVSSGSILSVEVQYKPQDSGIYITHGSLLKMSNGWYNELTPLTDGRYDLRIRMKTSDGVYGYSSPIAINAVTPKDINIITTTICDTGTGATIYGSVEGIDGNYPLTGKITYTHQSIPKETRIFKIENDKVNSNVVWVATDTGIYRVDKTGGLNSVTRYSVESHNLITNLFSPALGIDANGFLYVGTDDGNDSKVIRFDTKYWNDPANLDIRVYDSSNSELSKFNSAPYLWNIFIASDNTKYFTHRDLSKVLKISDANLQTGGAIINLNSPVYAITEKANGDIYFGTADSLAIYSSGSVSYLTVPYYNIRALKFDATGNLWVGTTTRVYCYTSSLVFQTPSGLNNNCLGTVRAIEIDAGGDKWFYFSTGDDGRDVGGIRGYIGTDFTQADDPLNLWAILNSTTNSNIPDDNIRDAKIVGSDTWIGTDNGVVSYDGNWKQYSKANANMELPVVFGAAGYWESAWSTPEHGNPVYLTIEQTYTNGNIISKDFTVDIGWVPSVSYQPQAPFYPEYIVGQPTVVFTATVSNANVDGGDYIVKIQKSALQSGPFVTIHEYTNTPSVEYEHSFLEGERFYVKVIVESSNGCEYISNPMFVGASTAPQVVSLYTTSIDYSVLNPLTLNGQIIEYSPIRQLDLYHLSTSGENYIGQISYDNSGSFEYVWATPIASVSGLKVYATDINGVSGSNFTTFSNIKSAPSVSLLLPTDGFYKNSQAIAISAVASDSITVSAVSLYTNETLISDLTLSAGYWVGSSHTSSISTSAGGFYYLKAVATNVSGVSAESQWVGYNINGLPTYTKTSDYYVYHSGSAIVSGTIGDREGYVQTRVDILSADNSWNTLGFVTSGYSDNTGAHTFSLSSPTSGVQRLKAKVYDANPADTSAFSLTNIEIFTNNIQINLVSTNTNLVSIDGENVYHAIAGSTIQLSADITSQIAVSANFWFVEYTGRGYIKRQLITSDSVAPYTASYIAPSSRELDGSISTYTMNGFVVEAVDSLGRVSKSTPIKLYTTELSGSIAVTEGAICSDYINVGGTIVNSDTPYFGTPLLNGSMTAELYNSSNVKLADVNYARINDNDPFLYDNYFPISAISGSNGITLKISDNNGLVSTTLLNTGIITNAPSSAYLSVSGNVLYTSGNLFITSGDFVIVGNPSTPNVENFQIVTNSDGVTNVYDNSVNNNLETLLSLFSGRVYTIYGFGKTVGGCDVYTEAITVITKTDSIVSLNPSTCNSCYCSTSTQTITGRIKESDFSLYASVGLSNTLSASISDGVNVIGNISAVQYITETIETVSYNFTWNNLRVGTSALSVTVYDAYGYSYTTSTVLPKTITPGTESVLTLPDSYSVSGTIYPTTNVPMSIAITSGSVSKVQYYINDQLIAIQVNPSNGFLVNYDATGLQGIYNVRAVVVDAYGCYSFTTTKDVAISDGIFINISSPNDGDMLGKNVPTTFKSIAYTGIGSISAVDYLYDGVYTSAASGDTWDASLVLSASGFVSAIGYGTNDLTSVDVAYYNVINPPSASLLINNVSAISASNTTSVDINVSETHDANSSVSATMYRKNGSNWETLFVLNRATSSTFENVYLTYNLPVGLNELRVTMNDQFGNSSVTNVVSATISASTTSLSNPLIKLVSSTPATKISKSDITSVFEISDYNNGIFTNSIALTSASVGTISNITTIVPGKKYQVEVIVSATGSVEISASNMIGRVSTLRVDNYIRQCSSGRELNLTRFLPENDQFDYYGNDSEFKQFTKFFEDYLNTIYTNADETCSLSVLEKVASLTSLHDIDTIDAKYIPYLANMMGYDIDINKSQIGTFGGNTTELSEDEFKEYQDKSLRFVVSNLPNWYSIKTTRNSMKIMLLSFGIIGDVIEYYTLDYKDSWKLNKVTNEKLVADDIGTDWFPTPHISIGINLNESDMEVVSSHQVQEQIINAMESIRPANVVINGILGYAETQLPDSVVTIKFQTTKSINVPSTYQIK